MKLTKEKALDFLEEAKELNSGRWIKHSITVGDLAGKIACKLNLDVDKAITMGYIHDIGKRYGKTSSHTIDGYNFLKKFNIDKDICNICLTHSYLNNDIYCTGGGYPDTKGEIYEFRKKFIENHSYTIYDKIINICDLVCTDKTMTLEKRLIDIIIRKGVYDNTVYHIKEAIKLKKEIEDLLNCSIYSFK